MLLALVALVLPNAVALAVMAAGVSLPTRSAAILGYVTAVLLARRTWPILAVPIYLLVAICDLSTTIGRVFHLSLLDFAIAARYAPEVGLADSLRHVAATMAVAMTLGLAIILMVRARGAIQAAAMLPTVVLGVGVAGVDLWATTSPHYQFGAAFAVGRPFESAAISSGFNRIEPRRGGPNVLVVVVESLGAFGSPDYQALLSTAFATPALTERYVMTSGTTTFFGSTTAGEMRELCGSRESFTAVLDGASRDCLPARFAAAGYRTAGFHAYAGAMFDRRLWWPLIGLQVMTFLEEMEPELARSCGRIFAGACDGDVAGRVKAYANAAQGPAFLYWLTLNSHVPVQPGDGNGRLNCAGGGPLGNEEVCTMAELWLDVFDSVVALATDPRLPPFEILVVGDHGPPLWSRSARNLFRPGEVSWFRLSPRAE